MSASVPQADDSIDTQLTGGDMVTDYTQFHGKLQAKLEQLQEWVDEGAADSYEMEVKYTPAIDGSDRVSVSISSDDWVLNKGEIGDRRFHIILGEQGRLALAQRRTDILGSERDYVEKFDTKGDAWKHLGMGIKRAE